jgi:hypothetical protein
MEVRGKTDPVPEGPIPAMTPGGWMVMDGKIYDMLGVAFLPNEYGVWPTQETT